MSKETVLEELIALSHALGEEAREYVIIGEGNTSARIDDATFWVKASSANLRTITAQGFVEVRRAAVLELFEGAGGDEQVGRVLMSACVDSTAGRRPSVETILHAVLYDLTDAAFIGHTHPTAANALLCSAQARLVTRHLMPDPIVVCGAHMIFVPYTDPGVPLAREVHARVSAFISEYAEMPRVLWLQNHGVFALGASARQVENVTHMAVKHAQVLTAALALGEPHWLGDSDIARIHTRPDELLRRARFG